ncbi:hypothetical protein CEP50_06270 [Actinopolyspora mortivallis]|uniref:Uncharacterized protein n=2 Tax=Actinopolyspora mortivallis TaxID=33906 RepID=A0A2T0GYW4_ACTMO|nr:hypothetical protein CEP50_06270 [Actinopolyspora mortivallis]
MLLAHEQWRLEQLSYDVARRRCTARQCCEAAAVLERLSAGLREYAASLPFEQRSGHGTDPFAMWEDDRDD